VGLAACPANALDAVKQIPDIDAILEKVKEMYASEKITDIDGVKIDFPDKWVHLRKSNTEPIIRVYSEAATMEEADALGKKLMQVVYDMQ
jgi:phosphomannomutase